MRVILWSIILFFTNAYILSSDSCDDAYNAVVKVFVTEKKFNWFFPQNIDAKACTGTGFFINKDGYIVTCAHVIQDATSVTIRIPSLGKKELKAHVVGISFKEDVALLCLDQEEINYLAQLNVDIEYLTFGNAHSLKRGDYIFALGYPATQQSDLLKGVSGVVSSNNGCVLQYDASVNPGNSGGPILNEYCEVVGVCTSGDREGLKQGINFGVPSNIVELLLPHLFDTQLLIIPDFGLMTARTTNNAIKKFFNCDEDMQGCYIYDVHKGKQAFAVGIRPEDILYEIDGYPIDNYGDIISPFNEERIAFTDYINQMPIGSKVKLSVCRKGTLLEFTLVRFKVNSTNKGLSFRYPAYQDVDFEVFGGLIIMDLTENYIRAATQKPALMRHLTILHEKGPQVVIANIMVGSDIWRMNNLQYGDTINMVNGEKVTTLAEFKNALLKSLESGYLVLQTTDELMLNSDKMITVLPLYDSCKEAVELSRIYNYPLSDLVRGLIEQVDSSLL